MMPFDVSVDVAGVPMLRKVSRRAAVVALCVTAVLGVSVPANAASAVGSPGLGDPYFLSPETAVTTSSTTP
jgi:hypothetical protein